MRVVLAAVLMLVLAGCAGRNVERHARPLAERADHLAVCDGREDEPAGCRCTPRDGVLENCPSVKVKRAQPLTESADHLVVCDGREFEPAGCAVGSDFSANFTPLALPEPDQVVEPDPIDPETFRKMVEEMDREVAPCRVVWSGTFRPHPIDVSCPPPKTTLPPTPKPNN